MFSAHVESLLSNLSVKEKTTAMGALICSKLFGGALPTPLDLKTIGTADFVLPGNPKKIYRVFTLEVGNGINKWALTDEEKEHFRKNVDFVVVIAISPTKARIYKQIQKDDFESFFADALFF